MEIEQLVIECKKGLNMSLEADEIIDGAIKQKLLAIRAYLLGAGVKTKRLDSDLGIAVMVIGVTDLWNLNAGEIKFSPVFRTLATQLALGGSHET
ncbi:hypothetical protein [Lysinibacillus sp. RC79]|uniref:hypothetical protein n=1 Tax=Lysinibacillus sp. RC79 TaxID=3156296 RepID=UPI003517A31A